MRYSLRLSRSARKALTETLPESVAAAVWQFIHVERRSPGLRSSRQEREHRLSAGEGAPARSRRLGRSLQSALGPPNEDPLAKFLDLMMLVSAGGHERTEEEWRALLADGGFELVSARRATRTRHVIEAAPV